MAEGLLLWVSWSRGKPSGRDLWMRDRPHHLPCRLALPLALMRVLPQQVVRGPRRRARFTASYLAPSPWSPYSAAVIGARRGGSLAVGDNDGTTYICSAPSFAFTAAALGSSQEQPCSRALPGGALRLANGAVGGRLCRPTVARATTSGQCYQPLERLCGFKLRLLHLSIERVIGLPP